MKGTMARVIRFQSSPIENGTTLDRPELAVEVDLHGHTDQRSERVGQLLGQVGLLLRARIHSEQQVRNQH